MTLLANFQPFKQSFGLQSRYSVELGSYMVFSVPIVAMESVSIPNAE